MTVLISLWQLEKEQRSAPSRRTLKVSVEALIGSQQHVSTSLSLRELLGPRQADARAKDQGWGGGGGPPIARVQLEGHLASHVFPMASPYILQYMISNLPNIMEFFWQFSAKVNQSMLYTNPFMDNYFHSSQVNMKEWNDGILRECIFPLG